MAALNPEAPVPPKVAAKLEYYDIMFVGNTGQGKSTSADKILIANPTGHNYKAAAQPTAGVAPVKQPGLVVDDKKRQLQYDDITIWLGQGVKDGEFETHLKFLSYCRTKDKPHEEVNKSRSATNNVFKSTVDCEVLSNETSKTRVMDVPGFFDGASILSEKTKVEKDQTAVEQLGESNLDIMRKIVRIQTALSMEFKRILYFLPVRGPLERASAHLKLELSWMAHFFGTSIFKTMVLVATVPARYSKMPMSDEDKFPKEDIDQTMKFFSSALEEVFKGTSERPLPDPPLIFISLTNTCEEILDKVKEAVVEQEGLHLQIDPNTCAECGVKIGVVKGKRVTCYFGEDLKDAIPYEESTCHPYMIPRYTRIDKLWGGFKHVVTSRWRTQPWPVFDGEKCVACGSQPNERGCKLVNTEYKRFLRRMTVDHTNLVVNPVQDEQDQEEGDAAGERDEPVGNGTVTAGNEPQVGIEQQNGSSLHIKDEIHPNQPNVVQSAPPQDPQDSWRDKKRT